MQPMQANNEPFDIETARQRRKRYFGTLIAVSVFLFPWLLGFSFDTIDPGEVGLLWNQNLNNLDTKSLRDEGRHWVGLGCYFVKFPTYAQQVSQNYIGSRTKDGLAVKVKPAFQYKINKNLADVTKLYLTYGLEYEKTFISIARSNIRDVISTFNAYELVSDRDTLTTDLFDGLKVLLAPKGVTLIGYQLLSIQWSNTIDNAIMAAVTELENVKTAHAEKNISKIESLTTVEEAKVLSEGVVITANQTAKILLANKKAEAQRIVLQGTAQADAFAAVKGNMTLSSNELLKYVYLENLVGGMNSYAERQVSVKVPVDIQTALDTL